MSFIDKLRKFWNENLLKNYKKISSAIGGLIASLVGFITFKILIPFFPFYETLIISLYTFFMIFIQTCFGQEDGLTKQIKKILKEDPEVRKAFKEYVLISEEVEEREKKKI